MKHLTLQGEIVFEIFTKTEKKEVTRWCKRLDISGDVIITSSLDHYGEPIETEVDTERLFNAYLYYYSRKDVYNKLKEINFKFE